MPLSASDSIRVAPASAVCFAIGLLTGLTAFWDGLYGLSRWAPVALGVLVVLVLLAFLRPVPPTGPAAAAVAAVAGIWLLSLASTLWAESTDQAQVEAGRWLLYAAYLAALLPLLRGPGQVRALLAGATTAICVVAGYVAVRFLAGTGTAMFLGNRLQDPLGYVNGQTSLLMLGTWPFLALAEHARRPGWRAGALAGAVALAGMALLGGTRAVLPVFAVSAALMLALLPGRVRRAWLLVAFTAGLAIALPGALTVAQAAAPTDSDLRLALALVALAAVVAGGAWFGAERFFTGRPEAAGRLGAITPRLLGGIVVVVVIAGLAAGAGRISTAWEDFKASSQASSTDSRLLQSGGARYDYWRVSLNDLVERPVGGEGAGNWDLTYYPHRRTGDDTRQPHSLLFQTLAELGLAGGTLLLLAIGAVGYAMWRRRLDAVAKPILIAGGGMFALWLLHTSVDWLHIVPGLTLLSLCGAAAVLAPWRGPSGGSRRAVRVAVPVVAVAVAAAGFLTVGRVALADQHVTDGYGLVAGDPAEALRESRSALDLNGASLQARYLEGAALARGGDYEGARGALLAATREEPHDFVTWQLLGDLAARRLDIVPAGRYYTRAHQLNPRDVELRDLAAFPRLGIPANR